MSLSKKHFVKIAEILNSELKNIEEIGKTANCSILETNTKKMIIEHIEHRLSNYFATENNLFNKERFKRAVFEGVV
jgi:hypothetical protein